MKMIPFSSLTDLQQIGAIAALCAMGVKENVVIHPMTKLWNVRLLSKTRWQVTFSEGIFNVSFEVADNHFTVNDDTKVSLAMISALRKRFPATFKESGES